MPTVIYTGGKSRTDPTVLLKFALHVIPLSLCPRNNSVTVWHAIVKHSHWHQRSGDSAASPASAAGAIASMAITAAAAAAVSALATKAAAQACSQ